MAATMNRVFLMGNLTRDPDLRQLPSGEDVAELGLAVSEQYKSRSTGEVKEIVTFVDITVWGATATNCGRYLSKGRPVFIEGRLVLDTWEDGTTKQKRSRLRVRADRVQFLNPPPQRAETRNPSGEWKPLGKSGSDPKLVAPDPAKRDSDGSTTDADDMPF